MTSAVAAPDVRGRHRYRRPTASRRRLVPVLLDLPLAVVICVVGFRYGAGFLQVHEARWVAQVLTLLGADSVSGALPRNVLVFRPDGEIIVAEVTQSCSSILSLLGLTALTAVVLRGRRQHAVAGLVVAVAALLLLNDLRLVASTIAGVLWGGPALVLFHDWVGTRLELRRHAGRLPAHGLHHPADRRAVPSRTSPGGTRPAGPTAGPARVWATGCPTDDPRRCAGGST